MMVLGVRYSRSAGDFELTNPIENRVDAAVRSVCRRYAGADPARQARWRIDIADEYWTLWAFARRNAVFALRAADAEPYIIDGLTAVAMIHAPRVDPRDRNRPMPLLQYAAVSRGLDAARLFERAAHDAAPEMAELLRDFSALPVRGLRTWCYAVVQTDAGPGFVEQGSDPYDPTVELDRIALGIADVIGADERYRVSDVSLGSLLPPVWLQGIDRGELGRALAATRAGATIRADLRADIAGDLEAARGIMVFLIELRDEAAAASLARIAEAKRSVPSEIAILGVSAGVLFALLVARSFVQGVPPLETANSVGRFAAGIAEVLTAHLVS